MNTYKQWVIHITTVKLQFCIIIYTYSFLQLTVVHPKSPVVYTTTTTNPTSAPPASLVDENLAEPQPAHAQVGQHSVEAKQAQTIFGNYLEGSFDEHAQAIVAGGGHAVTIIIVVCVGFLVLMITLGIVRIKAAHQKASQDEVQDTEMAWDDSALNITINPMEVNIDCFYNLWRHCNLLGDF